MTAGIWGRRSIAALFAFALVASACGGDDGGSSSGANDTSATTSDGGSDTSTGGGGGSPTINDDHGKVKFDITGDATAKGELPFVYVEVMGMSGLSVYDDAQNGWVAWFGKGGDNAKELVQLHTGSGAFIYTNGDVIVTGTQEQGCTFDYSKNDKDGFKGSVDCSGAQVLKGATMGKADIKATFEGHK